MMDRDAIHDPFAYDGSTDAMAASFAPVPLNEAKAAPAEKASAINAADKVGAEQGFTARKRKKKSTFRRTENFRSGRSERLSLKATAEAIEQLAQITDERAWVKGQTLQYALDALAEKINDPQDSFWQTHNFHGVD